MGVSLSCPFASCSHVEDGLDSIIVKSINYLNDEFETPKEKMTIETPMSFKRKDMEMYDPKHMAAVILQKVYKSFRTRRKLADCAVLIEQSWYLFNVILIRKNLCSPLLLDYSELKHSSVSFFDIEKHETAISRWSRARTKVAKVGKGLSKDVKARKLALFHWLEAIDPRHPYGHNLHFYYDKWLKSQSREPFFYRLDIGEGKEINLEKCPRAKLQQQYVLNILVQWKGGLMKLLWKMENFSTSNRENFFTLLKKVLVPNGFLYSAHLRTYILMRVVMIIDQINKQSKIWCESANEKERWAL